MVSLSHPKSPNSLNVLSMKSPSSSLKIKTLIHNLVFSHIVRLLRALSNSTKSIFMQIFREFQFIAFKESHFTKKNKYLFGSFRLHYNWCSSSSSSHVMPMPSPPATNGILNNSTKTQNLYHDNTWNSSFSRDDHCYCNNSKACKEDTELASYLQWLEEKGDGNNDAVNEIDKLADLFIANCHEKFRLEKIESYRRFQEMLVRSM
ncbi:hypothetical protein Nepgr_020571 [Nepenthes gracilis]|uniref:Uncharacterized protein n=1 Tax=Nepenthes gracilis TaxID=150966 RepID=A0AAD3SX33_NEPGR|nr:hypothetical protein Nepgr_020571 [Nepenthes gracilis]